MLHVLVHSDPSTDFGRTAETPAQQAHFPSFLPTVREFPQYYFRATPRSFQRVELHLTPIRSPGGCFGGFRRVRERNTGPVRPVRRGQVVFGIQVGGFPLPSTLSHEFCSKPTALDALVFAYLHSILSSSHQIRLAVTRRANLVAWHNRVRYTIQPCFVAH